MYIFHLYFFSLIFISIVFLAIKYVCFENNLKDENNSLLELLQSNHLLVNNQSIFDITKS